MKKKKLLGKKNKSTREEDDDDDYDDGYDKQSIPQFLFLFFLFTILFIHP
jgi:hypothetical protein